MISEKMNAVMCEIDSRIEHELITALLLGSKEVEFEIRVPELKQKYRVHYVAPGWVLRSIARVRKHGFDKHGYISIQDDYSNQEVSE